MLIRLLDENAQSLTGQIVSDASGPQQPLQRAENNNNGYLTIIRDEKLCSKVVLALDAMLRTTSEEAQSADIEHKDGDSETSDVGFPMLSADSAKALMSDSLLMILVQYAPNAGKFLIPKLCDCSISRAERCFEKLLYGLSSSQWPAKAAEAAYTIPDLCEVWKHLMISLNYDPNARLLREQYLVQLTKLVKEGKRLAAERKEGQLATTRTYYPSTYADERVDHHRAAVFLVMHSADLINYLALHSDACRSVLKQLKWNWLVQAVDVNSFESFLGGNEFCGVREMTRGKTVRTTLRTAISLGQLPRPLPQPCFTLAFHVEDAGSVEVNGLYRFDGFFPPGASDNVDTVTPKFARVDPATGKRFTIFRCSATESQLWYISELSDKPGTINDIDYYQAKDTGSGIPEGRWITCGLGVKPSPKHLVSQRAIPNPEDDLLEYFAG
jgi:hypothetical protein